MHIDFTAQRIWLSVQAVDFRKCVNGLTRLIVDEFKDNPAKGLYVFHNKACNRLKILGWHGNGFVLVYKRLEKGRFKLDSTTDKLTLSHKQLKWLLAGLDWQLLSGWNSPDFKDYY